MKKNKISDPDGHLNDYSEYLLLEYRKKLLHVLLNMCFIIMIGLALVNFLEWQNNPRAKWGTYNLISDAIAFGVLVFLSQINQKGFISLAGWLFGLIVIATVPVSYPLSRINQTFLIMALPVAVSSFVIRPWASFVFACLILAFYNATFLQYPGAFAYDSFSLIALCILAVGSYLISRNLHKAISDAVRAYDETIQGWAKALEMRDSETMGHSQRIVELTLLLAQKLGVQGIDLFHMRRGALLHDIGKMGIPDAILHKPGKLSDEEWTVMRKHPIYARDYLSKVSHLASALDIPYSHHEKWDGTGYPQGLRGEEIPIAARIFAVVDVWDALTSNRPYLETWPKEQALLYIREQAGRQFDPRIVEAFSELIQSRFEIQSKEDASGDYAPVTRNPSMQVDPQQTLPR